VIASLRQKLARSCCGTRPLPHHRLAPRRREIMFGGQRSISPPDPAKHSSPIAWEGIAGSKAGARDRLRKRPYAALLVAVSQHGFSASWGSGTASRAGSACSSPEWALGDWLADCPALHPLSYAALRIAAEPSRGVGIWLGCARARDFRALRSRRPLDPRRR